MRITNTTFQFLSDLEKNNNRDWFEANKDRFTIASENFIQFTDALIHRISEFDPSIAQLSAKDCVFRLHRDTRFSKDKSPYKINFGAHLIRGGKGSGFAGYYFYCQPGASYIGGGIHQPEPAQLQLLRNSIRSNGKEFSGIVDDKAFTEQLQLNGEKLVKVPKGFDNNDPMGEYLKYKELVALHHLTDKEVLSEAFMNQCMNVFKRLSPFIRFINAALSEG